MTENMAQRLAQLSLGDDPFEMAYKGARDWERAEKAGDTEALKELDFGVGPMCMRCNMPCLDPATKQWKPMRCAGCQGVIYCSRSCQIQDWKTPKVPRHPVHKQLCARNKEHMKRLPYFEDVVKQFPWARVETDGTVSHDILKARLEVLGAGASFGYWSVPGGLQPHDAPSTLMAKNSFSLDGLLRKRGRAENYIHGSMLLTDTWPTDVEGWVIQEDDSDPSRGIGKLIPRLFFDDDCPPPPKPAPGQIKDWKAWYEWRGLTFASPAALLMDVPLSVYYLLTTVLEVVDLEKTSAQRKSLEVHLLGAEVELNLLPLFSELALLLPNVDLTLVFFGKAVCELVNTARKEYPGSLATLDTVWSYTAPRKSGGGSVNIKLHSESESWTRATVMGRTPDAMLGLNAGLLSYPEWGEPMQFSVILDIPFAVTEYCEQTLETCAEGMRTLCAQQSLTFPGGGDSLYVKALKKQREYPITVNPFHRPGQRGIPVVRFPNLYNGFALQIVKKDSSD